jgi:septum formation protein
MHDPMKRPLILASTSPRRAELLTSAGFSFVVAPPDVDETPLAEEGASDYVIRIARDKARQVAGEHQGTEAVILAADTAVVSGIRIMGKPRNDEDAANMLMTLSGSVHQVLTGVVVRTGTRELVDLVATRVHFLPLSSADVDWYVSTGEPRGKAGAYAIQGHAARFIDWIDGSWSNVVGLPLSTVNRMLRDVGVVN